MPAYSRRGAHAPQSAGQPLLQPPAPSRAAAAGAGCVPGASLHRAPRGRRRQERLPSPKMLSQKVSRLRAGADLVTLALEGNPDSCLRTGQSSLIRREEVVARVSCKHLTAPLRECPALSRAHEGSHAGSAGDRRGGAGPAGGRGCAGAARAVPHREAAGRAPQPGPHAAHAAPATRVPAQACSRRSSGWPLQT